MAFADRFIGAIGKMPFTAKHSARYLYSEATRAALRNNEARRRRYITRLGQIALTNDLLGVVGCVMSGTSAAYAVADHSPMFMIEAVGCALYAIGHGASGIAQHLMVRRHTAQAEAIAMRAADHEPARLVETAPPLAASARPFPRATFVEHVITEGGTALMLLPVAHMAVNQLVFHQ